MTDVELECWFEIEQAALAYVKTLQPWTQEWFRVYAIIDWLQVGGYYS